MVVSISAPDEQDVDVLTDLSGRPKTSKKHKKESELTHKLRRRLDEASAERHPEYKMKLHGKLLNEIQYLEEKHDEWMDHMHEQIVQITNVLAIKNNKFYRDIDEVEDMLDNIQERIQDEASSIYNYANKTASYDTALLPEELNEKVDEMVASIPGLLQSSSKIMHNWTLAEDAIQKMKNIDTFLSLHTNHDENHLLPSNRKLVADVSTEIYHLTSSLVKILTFHGKSKLLSTTVDNVLGQATYVDHMLQNEFPPTQILVPSMTSTTMSTTSMTSYRNDSLMDLIYEQGMVARHASIPSLLSEGASSGMDSVTTKLSSDLNNTNLVSDYVAVESKAPTPYTTPNSSREEISELSGGNSSFTTASSSCLSFPEARILKKDRNDVPTENVHTAQSIDDMFSLDKLASTPNSCGEHLQKEKQSGETSSARGSSNEAC